MRRAALQCCEHGGRWEEAVDLMEQVNSALCSALLALLRQSNLRCLLLSELRV